MSFDPRTVDYEGLGVPSPIASQLRERSYPSSWVWYWRAYFASTIALLVASVAPVAGLIFLSFRLDAARGADHVFYVEGFGFAPILLMVGSVCCGGWLAASSERLFRTEVREYLFARNVAMSARARGLGAALASWVYRRAQRTTTIDSALYVEAQCAIAGRCFAIPGAVLLIVGGTLTSLGVARYDLGTETGIERHSIAGVEHVPYGALDGVEVGCADGGRYRRAIYTLVLPGGDQLSAFPHRACRERGPRLVQLDRELRERGIPFRAATDSDGRPLSDPTCERATAQCMGMPVEVIHSLLNP